MQLQGRCWREGRVSPLDCSGGEELNRMHIQSSWIIHKGIKSTKTLPAAHSEFLVLFPSCLSGPARHLLPLQNHGDEFFHGPSVPKPVTEDRLASLPVAISQKHPSLPLSSFDPLCPPPLPRTGHLTPVANPAAVLGGGTWAEELPQEFPHVPSGSPNRGAARQAERWEQEQPSCLPQIRLGWRTQPFSGTGKSGLGLQLVVRRVGILACCFSQMGDLQVKTDHNKEQKWQPHFHTWWKRHGGGAVPPSQHPQLQANAVTSAIGGSNDYS